MATSAEPADPPALLAVEGMSVGYGRSLALEDISLNVARGEAVALIGPNGAGKSTLLKAILGLLPLTEGRVKVLGRRPEDVREKVGYVQQADTLDADFPVSVLQVVLMGRYRSIGWFRRPGADDRRTAMEALAEVGLGDWARDRFGTLSGGQRQRVLLARAIAQHAQLLLLDEPFNGLDATTTDILIAVLARMRADGVGVVMSTHDLAVAHLTCGDACVLNRRRVAFGPIAEAITPGTLAEAYGSRAVQLASGATVVTTTG